MVSVSPCASDDFDSLTKLYLKLERLECKFLLNLPFFFFVNLPSIFSHYWFRFSCFPASPDAELLDIFFRKLALSLSFLSSLLIFLFVCTAIPFRG